MQVVYKNEDERRSSRRTDPVDFVIHTRKVSKYVEREYIRRFRSKRIGI